jgi:hypothetical protein
MIAGRQQQREANNSRDANDKRDCHISRKDLYMYRSRKASNSREFSHSRDTGDETTAVKTHQEPDSSTRKVEQQGTPSTAGMPKPVEPSVEEGMLTTAATPQQEPRGADSIRK